MFTCCGGRAAPFPRTLSSQLQSRRRRSTFQAAFVSIAFAFLLKGVVDAWSQADGSLFPDLVTLGASAALWIVGLRAALFSWVHLLGCRNREITRGFLLSQVTKYVPGGFWQGISLVKSGIDAGVPARGASLAYVAFALTQLAAAAPLSLSLLAVQDVDTLVRVAAVVAFGAIVLLDRRLMAIVVRRLPESAGVTVETLPSQRRILGAWVGNVVSLACSSWAFLLLYADVAADSSGRVVGAFALAWFVGFAVAVVPAGLGLREVVLLAVLGAGVGGELVLTASAYHRLVLLVVEALVAGAVLIGWRRSTRRKGT